MREVVWWPPDVPPEKKDNPQLLRGVSVSAHMAMALPMAEVPHGALIQ